MNYKTQFYYDKDDNGLSDKELDSAIDTFLSSIEITPKKVLLIPPDITRLHSACGDLTERLYKKLEGISETKIMPALGTHEPMTEDECRLFFGEIPFSTFLVHDWRNEITTLGVVPSSFVNDVSEGIMNVDMLVQVNRELVEGEYDLIISLGQVVPHEVVGMANYTKNIVVGVGGVDMISKSHMLGALYGMERMMGRDHTPVRKVFDFAQEQYLKNMPLYYFQTVTTNSTDGVHVHGLFIGKERDVFEAGVKLSQEKNLIFVEEPFTKAIVYLDPIEFKSTWLGNKAIYRTRMAMADDGELIILAPGVTRFGEDGTNDQVIRKYGYIGRENILKLYNTDDTLKENESVAAHLVHGSSDGRFKITYCTQYLTKEEVESVGFAYMRYEDAIIKYNPSILKDGYCTLPDGEKIFYISNPALGLWTDKNRF